MAAKDKKIDKSKQPVVKITDLEARTKALNEALENIEKQYGTGAIIKLGDDRHVACEVVPSGIWSVDYALGVGGFPKGRIVEIYGPESSGKTTLALLAVAQAQKAGEWAAFIDAEHALDPQYASKLGVQIKDLVVAQPNSGEEGLEIVEALVRSGTLGIVVVDSVAALVPKSEINAEMGDQQVGLHARLMSKALRRLASIISKSNTVVIFLNQLREKVSTIGVYGNPETTTGGRALKFYSSIRMEIKRSGDYLRDGNDVIGITTRIKVVKNKMAAPFGEGEYELYYKDGVDFLGSMVDVAEKLEIVSRAGSWYSYNEERLGQGKNKVREFLKNNEDIRQEIENKMREKLQDRQVHPIDPAPTEKEEEVDFSSLDTKSLDDLLGLDEL